MKYAIVGLTKGDEYDEAVKIICKHKGIDPDNFRREIDNVFDDQNAALEVLKELKSIPSLQKCCWRCAQ